MMQKQKPLWERLYFDAAYVEIARLVGYQGTTYRAMVEMLEPLEQTFGKQRVQSATYNVVTFEGQMTCNPKPLAEVKLRPEVRRLCFQLLGPPPESEEAFMTNPDGSSRRAKQATTVKQKTPPAKRPRKKKAEPARPVVNPTENATEKPTENNRPARSNSTIMDQYRAAKEKHPDILLLFRVGDFYELFGEDAETAHKLLGLTLTTRDQAAPMAGFPHHQLETYLHKLLKEGQRVAVCEPVEESTAQRQIQHEITQVVAAEYDGK